MLDFLYVLFWVWAGWQIRVAWEGHKAVSADYDAWKKSSDNGDMSNA